MSVDSVCAAGGGGGCKRSRRKDAHIIVERPKLNMSSFKAPNPLLYCKGEKRDGESVKQSRVLFFLMINSWVSWHHEIFILHKPAVFQQRRATSGKVVRAEMGNG